LEKGLSELPILRTRFQAFHSGSEWYNQQVQPGEATFEEVFHDLWRITFTPAPTVRSIIQSELQRMDLFPGHYTSIHLRAFYATPHRPAEVLMKWSENAIRCASNLNPHIKSYFFTSDSDDARAFAMTYRHDLHVGTRTPNPNPPLHLDKASANGQNRPVSDFYDTFVDLYLLATGNCVTYNVGGFGKWALLISKNSSCFNVQDTFWQGIRNPCDWDDGIGEADALPPGTPTVDGHALFEPPIIST
jgi:hypothetical protein